MTVLSPFMMNSLIPERGARAPACAQIAHATLAG